MAKITFEYNDNAYTLEFSRRTVSNLEKRGFVLEDAVKQPATMLPQLFRASFEMHHPRIKPEVVDEIYENLENKSELFSELVRLYQAPLEALFDEPDDEAKKIKWTAA